MIPVLLVIDTNESCLLGNNETGLNLLIVLVNVVVGIETNEHYGFVVIVLADFHNPPIFTYVIITIMLVLVYFNDDDMSW